MSLGSTLEALPAERQASIRRIDSEQPLRTATSDQARWFILP